MMPTAIPTLMNTWKLSTATTPPASSVPKVSRDSAAIRMARHSRTT